MQDRSDGRTRGGRRVRPRESRVWVTIEEATGPGLELAVDRSRPGPVLIGSRGGGTFLGFDRGAVHETDGGDGTPLAAVVALPSSAAAGCWLEARVCGVMTDGASRAVLVTALPGHPVPIEPIIRVAAHMPAGELRGVEEAMTVVRRARERFRRRRAAGRGPLRPAWLPIDLETRATAGGSIASSAERGLRHLPPRFVRGLSGLLDADERILASVERPPDTSGGILAWRRARDRRAALLVLTDRQILWLVDHVAPSRYLLDWGVDAELLPLERLVDLSIRFGDRPAAATGLGLRTDAGETIFALAAELEPEARAFALLLSRFLPGEAQGVVRRRYPIEPRPFDPEPASRFGQGDEAARRVASLGAHGSAEPIAAFFAPRRERVKRSIAVILTPNELLAESGGEVTQLSLPAVRLLGVALSPLAGRVELHGGGGPLRFTYPSPLSGAATDFVRTCRRAWANATPTSAEHGLSG
jgi:hypothetical protein